jgi:hypothetical protein
VIRAVARAVCALVLVATLAACAAAAGTPPSARLQMGLLATSCTPDRAAAQAQAGIHLAVLDIAWDRYAPRPGVFDDAYADDVRQRVAACENAGIDVVLGPGLQYPPQWVLDLPAGTYRNEAGEVPDPPVANLVFSRAVREAAAVYLHRLDADLGLQRFAAIRIGTTHTGELGYPGPGRIAAFWGFDEAAQGGRGLADGVAASPLPGWRPGAPTATAGATAWWRWYTTSAVAALGWQLRVLRELGFTGDVHVPVAGRGVLPADLAEAVAQRLGGADPDGALGRGLDYPAQFAVLARLRDGRVVIDFTGLDDVTAVRARALDPPQDSCSPGDEEAVRTGDSDVSTWSAQRFTTAVARIADLPLIGENPGGPGLAHTGGAPDSDGPAAQLHHAPRYGRDCGLTQFYWAFEETLYRPDSDVRMIDLTQRANSAE